VGYIPSRGNRSGIDQEDHIIIIGAHHDHLGALSPGNSGDRIFNGADDNASGVSALLEIAEHFSRSRPDIGILFITFSAEELGLYGSRTLVETLPWVSEKTVAMINLDMIGRNPDKDVQVTYTGPPDYKVRLESLLPEDYRIAEHGNSQYISDSYTFAEKGVPTVFFFTGFHKDYHQPTDEAELLDYTRMQDIAETTAAIISDLSNNPDLGE
jgi:Zn-dependent M28 family amino/carboxypeptidase